MKRHIVFHDPRLARIAGGGESLTLRTIAALNRDLFEVTIMTRKCITSPLLLSFLQIHPTINVVGIDAPEDGCDKGVREFLREHNGQELWGKDDLVDDSIRFNSVAAPFYQNFDWDIASFSVLTDLFGLLRERAAFHIYGCPPVDMAQAEGPLLRQVIAISAPSRFIRDQFCSIMNGWVAPDRISMLAPGLPPAFFNRRLDQTDRDVDFVYAGRLVPRKGVHLILHALDVLRSIHRLQPTVVVAGAGPMKEELVSLCGVLNLSGQVSFAGSLSQSELIHLLDRARWFLYPVRKPEAFGLAPLEALARGVPTIVGEPGGIADYMDHSRNGFVIRECDADLLAAKMLDVCQDGTLRDRLEPNCVQTAQRFTWEQFTDRVNAFYADACESVY